MVIYFCYKNFRSFEMKTLLKRNVAFTGKDFSAKFIADSINAEFHLSGGFKVVPSEVKNAIFGDVVVDDVNKLNLDCIYNRISEYRSWYNY